MKNFETFLKKKFPKQYMDRRYPIDTGKAVIDWEDIFKAGDEFAEQVGSKWIREDPTEAGEYLVLHDNGDICKEYWVIPKEYPDKAYPYWSSNNDTITHWMPLLPKPDDK